MKSRLFAEFKIYRTGDILEYSMIEFQGDLESKSEEPLGGKLIGDLHFNNDVMSS